MPRFDHQGSAHRMLALLSLKGPTPPLDVVEVGGRRAKYVRKALVSYGLIIHTKIDGENVDVISQDGAEALATLNSGTFVTVGSDPVPSVRIFAEAAAR